MVRRERWEEVRRLHVEERVPIAEVARRLELTARPSGAACTRRPGSRTTARLALALCWHDYHPITRVSSSHHEGRPFPKG